MQALNPAIITKGKEKYNVQLLEKLPEKDYNESYIQEIIIENSELLRLKEIDVSCGRIASLCREFPVDSTGHSIDDLFIDSNGVLTIVECKLIRNHQATREVLGQILDYAKEIVKFDYKELNNRILKKEKKSLFEKASEMIDCLDQEVFEENVNRNLKEGRINLVIAGDRISRNVEELVTFLNGYTKMSFKIGVVEIQLYKLINSKDVIAIPNCLFKTVEYRLVRLGTEQDEKDNIIKPQDKLELFYEKIQKNTGLADKLRTFVDEICYENHLVKIIGRGESISLNIKTEDEENNLMSISDNGRVSFFGITANNLPENKIKIGREYIDTLCKAFGAEANYNESGWGVYPKIKGERLNIKTILKDTEKIKDEVRKIVNSLEQLNDFT